MDLRLEKNMKQSNAIVTTAKPRCLAKCHKRKSEDQHLPTFMKSNFANIALGK